ncbi:MAG: FG-GAP-like repeat-containing protein [Bryobacteraceae bacterium]
MYKRCAILSLLLSISLMAQSTCIGVNFLNAKTVNLKPSATSHINVVRQSDGSYTGFEVADASPYRVISTTPHFEMQFGACLHHAFPTSPMIAPPVANPPGAGSQSVVSEVLPSGQYLVASLGGAGDYGPVTIYFDIFDSGLQLVSETTYSSSTAGEVFYSLALADMNGDGKADLVAVSEIPTGHGFGFPGVWVFLGNGDGTFQTGTRQALAGAPLRGPVSFAVGDLNNDGKPDLVISFDDLPFVTALNNGDGTFNQLPAASSMNPILQGGSISLADLNGDGKLDLIFAPAPPAGAPNVQVSLGNGDGTFQSFQSFPALTGSGDATVAVGDVNGDGIPDIVTAGGSILFGDGKGGFPTRRDYVIEGSGSVMLADFDGDGKSDIIVGAGNPTFLSGIANPLSAAENPAASSSSPTLTVLFGQGGGEFLAAPVALTGSYPLVATADFDGDGIPDLVTADGSANLTVLKGKGNGEFSPVFVYNFVDGFPGSLAVADFNRDGKPDVAVFLPSSSPVEVLLFLGKGDGTFAAPLVISAPDAVFNGSPSFLGAVDLNGDGIPDLAVATQDAIWVWIGKGDGTFSTPASYPVQGAYGALVFGDFNGDGKVDVAVATATQGQSAIALLLGKGDGTFLAASSISIPVPSNPPAGSFTQGAENLVAADLNSDGRLDLASILIDNSGNGLGIAILLGKGDGTFQTPAILPETAYSLAAADLNGDGIPDLVLSGTPNGTVVLLGNGDGTFQPETQISSTTLQSLVIADFNRDGSPDVAGSLSNGVATFLNLSQPFPPLVVVSGASFALGPLAADTVASGFGKDLATATAAATTLSLPTNLAGTTVTVEDSTGVSRPAPLYFVSLEQVNFLIPDASALGSATITVTSGDGKAVSTTTSIVEFSPALFTVGFDGIAAAYVVRVAPGGAQTIEPVFTVQSGQIVPVPIDLTSPGQVYLILFGTGFDAASAASAVVNVQGVNSFVSYAGSQQQYPGLDQVNVLLPPSLAGSGLVSVVLTVAGTPANTVYVSVQ